jgi:hypothetical protein
VQTDACPTIIKIIFLVSFVNMLCVIMFPKLMVSVYFLSPQPSVKAGQLAPDAFVEFRLIDPGQARIGFLATSAIQGNGSIITLVFEPTGKEGFCRLILDKVEASDINLRELTISVESGQFDASGEIITGPVINFSK